MTSRKRGIIEAWMNAELLDANNIEAFIALASNNNPYEDDEHTEYVLYMSGVRKGVREILECDRHNQVWNSTFHTAELLRMFGA